MPTGARVGSGGGPCNTPRSCCADAGYNVGHILSDQMDLRIFTLRS